MVVTAMPLLRSPRRSSVFAWLDFHASPHCDLELTRDFLALAGKDRVQRGLTDVFAHEPN